MGRDSFQQNVQKESEMWNFYCDTEDMALHDFHVKEINHCKIYHMKICRSLHGKADEVILVTCCCPGITGMEAGIVRKSSGLWILSGRHSTTPDTTKPQVKNFELWRPDITYTPWHCQILNLTIQKIIWI